MDQSPKASRILLPRITGLLVGLFTLAPALRADHISGASITYECVSGNQYRVYLDLFLDCAGAAVTTQTIHFSNSCGTTFDLTGLAYSSFTEVSPLCPSLIGSSTCNGGTQPGFRKYRFQVTLVLTPCNYWKIDWYTCCRNTLQNVNLTPGTYVVATLNNASTACDHSPVFADSGVPYACVNQPVSYNPGVSDPDGNDMVFALISARYAAPSPTMVTYINGYTGALPISGMIFDPTNGQMYFMPTTTGYYVVVYEVTTYNNLGQVIGKVMRDLMFVVTNCDGNPPTSTGITSGTNAASFGPVSFVACGSGSVCVTIPFADAQSAQTVTVTSNATAVLPGATFSVSGTNPATATICWTVNQAILPVSIWLQATDNACPIANDMSTFITAFSCIYLPVELLEFTATPEGNAVQLDWTTGSETGSSRFVLERSADGSSFISIGDLPATGYSATETHYVFRDDHPLPATSYYRLREVDMDGTMTTGRTVAVDRSMDENITAAWDGNTWLLHGTGPGWAWELFDPRGAKLGQGTAGMAGDARIPGSQSYAEVLVVRSPARSYRMLLPPATWTDDAPVLVRSR